MQFSSLNCPIGWTLFTNSFIIWDTLSTCILACQTFTINTSRGPFFPQLHCRLNSATTSYHGVYPRGQVANQFGLMSTLICLSSDPTQLVSSHYCSPSTDNFYTKSAFDESTLTGSCAWTPLAILQRIPSYSKRFLVLRNLTTAEVSFKFPLYLAFDMSLFCSVFGWLR